MVPRITTAASARLDLYGPDLMKINSVPNNYMFYEQNSHKTIDRWIRLESDKSIVSTFHVTSSFEKMCQIPVMGTIAEMLKHEHCDLSQSVLAFLVHVTFIGLDM